MFLPFYTILAALLLNECMATISCKIHRLGSNSWFVIQIIVGSRCMSGRQTLDGDCDIDDFEYTGDPITFACVSSKE